MQTRIDRVNESSVILSNFQFSIRLIQMEQICIWVLFGLILLRGIEFYTSIENEREFCWQRAFFVVCTVAFDVEWYISIKYVIDMLMYYSIIVLKYQSQMCFVVVVVCNTYIILM
eukprot:TRINITY_DN11702_c0_g1_i7.p4 TRINITY_DN11702_c0_g1~~TRINITY_DN11702_c0_g1_i7.p4  ORF type:complete len:115 (-),score=1.79 TRINITY_DN11702_c0_g1_i7:167-511(-)